MSDFHHLLTRNQQFAATYTGGMGLMPRFSTILLTCIDARVDPAHFLGLESGEALVFRNAGGRVTRDIELEVGLLWGLASKAAGERFSGFSLALVQHTDCGLERLANPAVSQTLSGQLGVTEATIAARAIADHTQTLHTDIALLRRSPLVPKELVVSGYLFSVDDGRVTQVVPPKALKDLSD